METRAICSLSGPKEVSRLPYRKPKTAEDLKKHALKRARLRYGLNLSDHDFWTLILQIRSRSAVLIHKRSNNRSIWEVQFRQQTYVVVYDKRRGTIVTFLCRRQNQREQVAA